MHGEKRQSISGSSWSTRLAKMGSPSLGIDLALIYEEDSNQGRYLTSTSGLKSHTNMCVPIYKHMPTYMAKHIHTDMQTTQTYLHKESMQLNCILLGSERLKALETLKNVVSYREPSLIPCLTVSKEPVCCSYEIKKITWADSRSKKDNLLLNSSMVECCLACVRPPGSGLSTTQTTKYPNQEKYVLKG